MNNSCSLYSVQLNWNTSFKYGAANVGSRDPVGKNSCCSFCGLPFSVPISNLSSSRATAGTVCPRVAWLTSLSSDELYTGPFDTYLIYSIWAPGAQLFRKRAERNFISRGGATTASSISNGSFPEIIGRPWCQCHWTQEFREKELFHCCCPIENYQSHLLGQLVLHFSHKNHEHLTKSMKIGIESPLIQLPGFYDGADSISVEKASEEGSVSWGGGSIWVDTVTL